MSKPKTAKASAGGGEPLDPEIIAVMRLAADLQRASSRHLKGLWRERGLSERALFILELVHAGLDRPSRLIEYFDVLPSTITFETEKLVAAGLIIRESLPTDRRVVQLKLTPKGVEVHRETTQSLNELLRPRLAALAPQELEAFLATFEKIVHPIPASSASTLEQEAATPQSAVRTRKSAAGRGT